MKVYDQQADRHIHQTGIAVESTRVKTRTGALSATLLCTTSLVLLDGELDR